MIRVSLDREPITVALTGPFQGATLTLRRLTSPEMITARLAAQDLMKDTAQLVEMLDRNDVWPEGPDGRRRRLKDFTQDVSIMMGLSEWVVGIECGVRAIKGWTGVHDETGAALPVTREVLETLCQSEPFLDQLLPALDRAAQILVIEGNASGGSPSGSSATLPTPTPPTATTAASATNPAPPAARDETASSAPNRKTRRARKKASPSGPS